MEGDNKIPAQFIPALQSIKGLFKSSHYLLVDMIQNSREKFFIFASKIPKARVRASFQEEEKEYNYIISL